MGGATALKLVEKADAYGTRIRVLVETKPDGTQVFNVDESSFRGNVYDGAPLQRAAAIANTFISWKAKYGVTEIICVKEFNNLLEKLKCMAVDTKNGARYQADLDLFNMTDKTQLCEKPAAKLRKDKAVEELILKRLIGTGIHCVFVTAAFEGDGTLRLYALDRDAAAELLGLWPPTSRASSWCSATPTTSRWQA